MSKQVKIIIQNNEGKYLLIKRVDKEKIEHFGNWECPGGKLEDGESFEDAAIREVKEETNLEIEHVKVVKKLNKDGETIAIVFLGKSLTKEVIVSDEHSDYDWFTYEELKKLEPITHKKFFLELLKLSKSIS
jgi:8-oxo-dGTP diphosphatase